jgi:hypothetical protein
MKLKYTFNGDLPVANQYVLAHLTTGNRGDRSDPAGNRYWVVVKFLKGLSVDDRAVLPEGEEKRTYSSEDQAFNNHCPYCWGSFGPATYFGQDVDVWCELPSI